MQQGRAGRRRRRALVLLVGRGQVRSSVTPPSVFHPARCSCLCALAHGALPILLHCAGWGAPTGHLEHVERTDPHFLLIHPDRFITASPSHWMQKDGVTIKFTPEFLEYIKPFRVVDAASAEAACKVRLSWCLLSSNDLGQPPLCIWPHQFLLGPCSVDNVFAVRTE